MGNVLAAISKDNARFTSFENDQVLTADQLNDLFNYLDVETRLTRTKAIGVGIICGLEIGMLENNHIVVSKGAAITTDGDLLYFDENREFDLYELFEDLNAKYSCFRVNNNQLIPVYELRASTVVNATGLDLSVFERKTNTGISDYIGVLYLEDFKNDPDVCTGTDCDNKGAELVRDLKVLLIHKSNMKLLQESIPAVNKNYFALDEIAVPRISVKTTIDTYKELNTAIIESLAIKEEIKNKLAKAYEVCRPLLEDEFDGRNPTTEWSSLLDDIFKTGSTIYGQYVYDFARDMSYAYNELQETLFTDNMLCCPDVAIFPKHVLMGLVKTASVNRSLESPVLAPLSLSAVSLSGNITTTKIKLSSIRFDIGSFIRRFNSIHIDLEYRHRFYESPVLNNKEENEQQTKFCFMRINAMIKNFKVPTAEELKNLNQSLKITPSHFEDKPLGERSIPFYYSFNAKLPSHLYWDFKSNVRKKENQIYSYFSNFYATTPAALFPLRYNLLPYNFFRIEGHIGFNHADVEARLNQIIDDNNLPIKIVTVQVEHKPETITIKPWVFPELHTYEQFVHNTFLDHLNQIDILHNNLKLQVADDPAKDNINLLVTNFNNAKSKVLTYVPVTQGETQINNFKQDVQNVIKAVTEVKAQTKQFTFSNTAIPHDFIINTDILHKTDLFTDLIKQKVDKKIQDLILGNFMKKNPGLEHTGGVLQGGTFILVYTSDDRKVVADFMLPYSVVDKEVVADPPVFKPMLPPIQKLDLPKVLEKVPHYVQVFDDKIKPLDIKFNTKFTEVDTRVNGMDVKVNNYDTKLDGKLALVDSKATVLDTRINGLDHKFDSYDTKIDGKMAIVDSTIKGFDVKVGSFDERLKSNVTLFTNVLEKRNVTGGVTDNKTIIGQEDFTSQIEALQRMQSEIETLPATTPAADRKAKETLLIDAAEKITNKLNQPAITGDSNNARMVKSVLYDVHTSVITIKDRDLVSRAEKVSNLANDINKGFRIPR